MSENTYPLDDMTMRYPIMRYISKDKKFIIDKFRYCNKNIIVVLYRGNEVTYFSREYVIYYELNTYKKSEVQAAYDLNYCSPYFEELF